MRFRSATCLSFALLLASVSVYSQQLIDRQKAIDAINALPAVVPPPVIKESCNSDGTPNGVDEDQDGAVDEICKAITPPPGCVFSFNSSGVSVGAAASEGSVSLLVAPAGCQPDTWTAVSGAAWLAVGVASGTGPAVLGYVVSANTSTSPRTGQIAVNGATFTVNQAADVVVEPEPSCSAGKCWYVRPNGGTYGAENGLDWNNAFDGFSDIALSSVACGDTIWVAGGNYTSLTPNKTCPATNRVNLRRARLDALGSTSAPGWNASFASLVNQGPSGSVSFNSNNSGVLISGRTTSAGATCGLGPTAPTLPDTSGCGWKVSRASTTGGCGICVNGGSTANVIEYVELQGPGRIAYSSDGRAVDLTPSTGTASNYTFSHMVIRGWESAIYAVACSSPTFEYLDVSNIAPTNTTTFHPNGLITWGCPTGIVRYSTWHKGTDTSVDIGEGVFFEQAGGSGGW